MYREILFRGKRIDNGEWAEGCLLIDYETGQHFIHARGNSLHENNKANKRGSLNFSAYEIEPQTASQYTGMEDRNGRRIFENDLIYSDFNKVEFLGGSWCVNGDRNLIFYKDDEVVGNYFDLKEKALYVEVAHFEGSEEVDRFHELRKQDPEGAVSFLAQWDYGENDGSPEMLSQIKKGLLYVNCAEYGDYVALWQTGVAGITFYRQVREKEN